MPKPVKVDRRVELPKFGDRIPAERFHVSKMNVRFNEPFGESERDKILIENLRRGKIVEPFKARPESNGYGVYLGRRRYLAKEKIGTKAYVVGQDLLIENVTDEQAREQSVIDNLDIMREETDPITRARGLQDLVDGNLAGLRAEARKLGIPASTLSDYTKVLELTKPMQDALKKGQIYYKDARDVVRLKVGEIKQEELAKAAETGGREAFVAEVQKIQTGMGKRGIAKGTTVAIRLLFKKTEGLDVYDQLGKLASARNMKLDEYAKWVLTEHIKTLL